jgi:hypothetical protein
VSKAVGFGRQMPVLAKQVLADEGSNPFASAELFSQMVKIQAFLRRSMGKLHEDALRLTVQENLQNIRTLLEWAEESGDLAKVIGHAEQAHRLLGDVVSDLRALSKD